MESHRKGDLTEAVVIAELKRRSIPVSLPFGDNERYDLVIETPSQALLRVQVKTGWLSNGKIQFHTRSQHTNSTGNTYKPYHGDVDYFAVFCHELETLYLVREDEFDESISLRVEAPKMENRRINWARDFEFDSRWPPDSDDGERPLSQRETITQVIEKLNEEEIPVAKLVESTRHQLIVRPDGGVWRHMLVKSGWIDDGCVRYNHEPISHEIHYLAIYLPKTDALYIVPRQQFASSITLRVEEPKKRDRRINWAEEYAFPDNGL